MAHHSNVLMNLTTIDLFDVNDKIRMNGFIHTANPNLRFILERNTVDRIEFGNIFLSNRPVVNAVKILPFGLGIFRISIVFQRVEKLLVYSHGPIVAGIELTHNLMRS